jgi:isoquinoline 1-oxidoreductase beta subunit
MRHAAVAMCPTRGGRVAAFDAAAARQPLPRDVVLKAPERFTLIGRPTLRLDARDKMDGRAGFGIDTQLPGMRHAAVAMCPTRGGRVAAFDAAAARALPGVQAVVAFEPVAGGTGGVAAVADTPWHAMKAAAAVQATWDHGPAAELTSAEVMRQLAATLDADDGLAFHTRGDVRPALQGAATRLQAEYRAPYLAHLAMEPINCTVQVERDAGGAPARAAVWAPTQVPAAARRAAARALGLASADVTVHVTYLGGGFGRRLEVDYVAQAAAIAAAAGGTAPVQVLWSRADDLRHDLYRPACVARLEAGFDAGGRLVALSHISAGQSIVPAALGRLFGLPAVGIDKTAIEGAYDQPYEVPAQRVAHADVDLPLPVGFWRAVGHSHQAFFKEAFIDECATHAGQDAVAFRLALLAGRPRHAAVLRACAERTGWGTAPAAAPDGAQVARGIALHESFGSIVAQAAEVSIGAGRAIRVHRVVCVVDCGTAVNPAGISQQMESAIVFGLSAALYGEIAIERGQVQASNFHDQPVLRLPECPRIETHVMPSSAPPEGIGEPGLPPIAPAVAGALFALTGQRLRSLPLRLA